MKKITKIDGVQKNTAINSKLRVAAYCRVSTGSDAQLESLEAQKSHYEQYINSREDWQFAGLYFDEGITGTKAEKRPELLRLVTDCEARRIDFVITKSISRFSRNTTDCLALVRKLQSLEIPIYFEKENINTGSMESELFLAILSSMAEGESASISENAKWSVKRRFQNGTYKLGYTPYGYDWDGKNMIINPDQTAVVKRIFADILSGKSTNAIADELNAEKVPSKKNANWTSSTIRGIIANEKYTGDVIFQKTYTDENFNRHTNYGEVDQYMAPDHHEAIISHSDFDAANALVNQRAAEKGIEKGSDKYQQRYAFSGKIICGECGDTFKRRIHSCTTYKYVAWACNTHLKNKESCHMKYRLIILFLRRYYFLGKNKCIKEFFCIYASLTIPFNLRNKIFLINNSHCIFPTMQHLSLKCAHNTQRIDKIHTICIKKSFSKNALTCFSKLTIFD